MWGESARFEFERGGSNQQSGRLAFDRLPSGFFQKRQIANDPFGKGAEMMKWWSENKKQFHCRPLTIVNYGHLDLVMVEDFCNHW